MKLLILLFLIYNCCFPNEFWDKIDLGTNQDLISISIDNSFGNGAIIGDKALFITKNYGSSWENIYHNISNLYTDNFNSNSKILVYNNTIIVWTQNNENPNPNQHSYSNKYLISSDIGVSWKIIELENKIADFTRIKNNEFYVRVIKNNYHDTLKPAILYTDNVFEGFNEFNEVSYNSSNYNINGIISNKLGDIVYIENYNNFEPPSTYSNLVLYNNSTNDTLKMLNGYNGYSQNEINKLYNISENKWLAYSDYFTLNDKYYFKCLMIIDAEKNSVTLKSIGVYGGDYKINFLNENKGFILTNFYNDGKNNSEIFFVRDLNNFDTLNTNIKDYFPIINEVFYLNDTLAFAIGKEGTLLRFKQNYLSVTKNQSIKTKTIPDLSNVKNDLYIESEFSINSYKIFDINSKTVLAQSNLNSKKINLNLEGLTIGIYFIEIKTQYGKKLLKFIKD